MNHFILSCAFILVALITSAQKDSLILNNNNVIVGEVKTIDRGVVTIETPYSDSDFKIEWNGISKIYTNTRFLITLSDGSRFTGNFETSDAGKIKINDEDGLGKEVAVSDIVWVKGVDEGFLSRVYANIDFGYSLTKANNQEQITLNSRLGYLADYWSLDMYYNSLLSRQTEVQDIRRQDAGIGFRYFLPHDWYLSADVTFLSNTEQALGLRTNAKLGAGNYIIHKNTMYWGVGAGAAANIENFSNETPDRQSWEGYFGTELNLYDIGDLNLFTSLVAYPSITESGRWRSDFRFDAKYSDFIIDDFYLRAGFTLNYDNRPAEVGRETDYIFSTGFGWEW
jgi:hypothetical protein